MDDTSLLLDGSEQSLNKTLQELDNFYMLSGLKLNCDKTKIVWIGSKKYSTHSIKHDGSWIGKTQLLKYWVYGFM